MHRLTEPLLAWLPDLTGVPERQQYAAGLAVSAFLHAVAFLFAVILMILWPRGCENVTAAAEQSTIEIEILPPEPEPEELAEAPKREITPAIERNGLEASEVAPERPDFQSDENMLAGSERAGNGLEPLPTQSGLELPGTNFKTQTGNSVAKIEDEPKPQPPDSQPSPNLAAIPSTPLYKPKPITKQYVEALERIQSGAQSPDSAPPAEQPAEIVATPPAAEPPPAEVKETREPSEDEIPIYKTPEPVQPEAPQLSRPQPVRQTPPSATPPPQLAMLTPQPPKRPQPVAPDTFQPELRQTRIEGSISNRRRPGIDAVKTPLGVYRRRISDQIQAHWRRYVSQDIGVLALGTVRLRFYITADGKVEDLQVVENDSNASFENVCLKSIQKAEIEPPPSDLEVMKDGRLELVFSFTLYDAF